MVTIIKKIVLILFIILISSVAAVVLYFNYPFNNNDNQKVEFIIEWGDSFTTVSKKLENESIIRNQNAFKLLAFFENKTTSIKAGKYTLPEQCSMSYVLDVITGGKQSFIKVTIPEGLTIQQISNILQDSLHINRDDFLVLAKDTTFIKSLNLGYGSSNNSLEGYIFPDTYNFPYGLNEKQLIRQLINMFKIQVSDSLIEKGTRYNMDLNQIITLASIIEGEAILDSEKPLISSVYHNRLKRGMLLQADPTIQYIIPDGPRRLLNRDLDIDSPFNTYKYAGLPPGPINNPGLSAIQSAVNPEQTRFLYFCADGKGGHVFSETLSQHNRAKKQFDKIRIQVAREKRRKGQQ